MRFSAKHLHNRQAETQAEHLSVPRLIAYGSMALPLQMILLATVVFLPAFYATDVGLSMTAIGGVFFLARTWDAITDVLIGGWSDRTISRWGRRKPWILLGMPLLMVSAFFLYNPPENATTTYLGLWLFFFYLTWTSVQIPYLSWGAEISPYYVERNRIAAFREGFGTAGIVLASGLPLLFLDEGSRSMGNTMFIVLLAILLLLPVTSGMALTQVDDRTSAEIRRVTWKETLAVLKGNKLFLRFVSAKLLFASAWNISLASLIFIIEYGLFLKDSWLPLILLMNLSGTICMYPVIRYAHNVNKHKMFCVGLVGICSGLILISLIPKDNLSIAMATFTYTGMFWAPILISSYSIVADTVDVATFKGAGREAGLYNAVYNMVLKFGQSLGVGIGLPLLESMGFSIDDPVSQVSQDALRYVCLYLPVVMTIPAIIMMWNYPLTRSKHDALRRWLARNARDSSSESPQSTKY